MDVYHKILVKLYEITDGKTSDKIDFIDLVKKEGFYPSYKDIFSHLNEQGWIVEAGRADTVSLTHWGVKEAKKASSGGGDNKRELEKAAKYLKTDAKQFLIMAEEFLSDINDENLKLVQSKFDDLNKSLAKVKENM
ncbi:MAG: hypothetical protein ACR2J3_07045 [Aridibacter sp.]